MTHTPDTWRRRPLTPPHTKPSDVAASPLDYRLFRVTNAKYTVRHFLALNEAMARMMAVRIGLCHTPRALRKVEQLVITAQPSADSLLALSKAGVGGTVTLMGKKSFDVAPGDGQWVMSRDLTTYTLIK